jgi:hypothetical protein
MADYSPLLTRALDALSDRSPQMRRAVYERARTALADQLRNLEPPLAEADIMRERLALDEAITRIELEQRMRDPLPESGTPAVVDVSRRPPLRGSLGDEGEASPAATKSAGFGLPRRGRGAETAPDLDGAGDPGSEPAQRERPRIETVGPHLGRPGRGRAIVLAVALAAVIGLIAVAAWLLRDRPADLPRQPAVAEAPPPAANEGKLGDRVAGDRSAASPASGPAPQAAAAPGTAQPRADLPVAQRAVLYEENSADAQSPKATQGRAVWRLDNLNAGQGQPLETIVRAAIDVPEARLTLNLTFRRNLDQTLPASHTVELAFTTAPGDPNRAVRDVGLLQLKAEEAVRGTPVSGLPVPVKENLFLIGLSNLSGDVERNLDLLLNRNWIDLPIRFTSGQRAILSFEKGVSGDQVLREAFQRWQQ